MRKTTRLAIGAGLMAALGCNPQIANLGGNGDSGGSAGNVSGDDASSPAALPTGVASTDQISVLSDAQASAVCAWLTQKEVAFEHAPQGDSTAGLPAGYVRGGGEGVGCGSEQLVWVTLNQQDCVLNLRHSPCAATMASLVECVNAWLGAPNANGGSLACSGGCSDFISSPSCSQTIFAAGDAGVCAYALPISPDASCEGDGGN
jgi:hypothetical protein